MRLGARDLGPEPVLMGIVNATPDSFSDGGELTDASMAARRALWQLQEGATIVDVGGESTRPGSEPVGVKEERRRVVPVVEEILALRPRALISVDTYRSEVAEAALDAGAFMINDITALGGDERMAPLLAERGAPVVLMHMQGEPRSMQVNPHYEDVVAEVREFLLQRAECAICAGMDPSKIVLDPGIGFGKAVEHNLSLLSRLQELTREEFPVLIGLSRKSFLGRIGAGAPDDPKERLFGTVTANALAYERGASIFRVHDVKANRQALAVVNALDKL